MSTAASSTHDSRSAALDVVESIANILDVGLEREALSALVELVENGCSPEALVAVVEEMRKEKPYVMRFGDPADNDPAAGCVIGIQSASRYHQKNHERKEIANTLLSASWTLQSSGLFIFIAWVREVAKHALTGVETREAVQGTARYWEVQAAQIYSVVSIIFYAILPTFFDEPLVKIVAPQLVGTIEWALLAAIVGITRVRINRIIHSIGLESSTKYLILTRTHHLLGYLMMMLIFQSFGMGMMDWDIVNWHPSFDPSKTAAGAKFIYDTSHPLRTDLCTVIYSTGFAVIPMPVIYIMYTGNREKNARKRQVESTAGKIIAVQNNAEARVKQLRSSFKNERERLISAVGKLETQIKHLKYNKIEIGAMESARNSMTAASRNELMEVMLNSDDVEIGSLIGKGGFGNVHEGFYKGEIVAVKQIQRVEEESIEQFRFECFLLKHLRHPNVVRFIGVCWDQTLLACVLEYVSNGSLQDHLKKCSGKTHKQLTWKSDLLTTAQEISSSLEYLHHARYWHERAEKGKPPGWRECIIHRDLKPDNLLMTEDWTVKLADFGEARALEVDYNMTMVGTPIYVAPEILKGDMYDEKVDTYSFSICLLSMIRAETSIVRYFLEALRKSMKRKNTKGAGIAILNSRLYAKKWRPLLPTGFVRAYPKFSKFISDCWADDPASRPSFSVIKKLLHSSISSEVMSRPEPSITFLSKEDDLIYQKREARGEEDAYASVSRMLEAQNDEYESGEDDYDLEDSLLKRKEREKRKKEEGEASGEGYTARNEIRVGESATK
ncbi:hypothetical protein TrCOL_g327 [Triparma columacea]|uniref:Protein kinase domain-containing protein n=1 Tax=Triparma columacea TaxID=722753 RepID=A0A9W7GB19_9STRA|nr:hypothetical protein TrCOL_g327 [Triparma columacea]